MKDVVVAFQCNRIDKTKHLDFLRSKLIVTLNLQYIRWYRPPRPQRAEGGRIVGGEMKDAGGGEIRSNGT